MKTNLKETLAQKLAQQNDIVEADTVPQDGQTSTVSGTSNSLVTASVVPEFAITLTEAKDRLLTLQTFVKDMMKPGVDYGLVPGCNKPSLLKPGAEKLCDIYGFAKQVEVINRIEDWSAGFIQYEVKTVLISKRTGAIESEGLGACNSKERKYKNQDAYSLVNTILKMAKKRSFVDAVLSATRSSDLFTQDVEDILPEPETPKKSEPIPPVPAIITPVNRKQLTEIFKFVSQNAIPLDKVKSILQTRYRVDASVKLTTEQAEDLKIQLKALIA